MNKPLGRQGSVFFFSVLCLKHLLFFFHSLKFFQIISIYLSFSLFPSSWSHFISQIIMTRVCPHNVLLKIIGRSCCFQRSFGAWIMLTEPETASCTVYRLAPSWGQGLLRAVWRTQGSNQVQTHWLFSQ